MSESEPYRLPVVEIPKAKPKPLWRELLRVVLVTTGLFFFVETFVVQGFRVYGGCMEPNLQTGEQLLGNKLVYRLELPARGDIIVFRYPRDPERVYVKRIIGVPGDTVAIRRGIVFLNGRRLSEPYVMKMPHGSFRSTHVPPASYFVLGDNRDQSSDSRDWGVVPRENIEGKAWLRYWPVSRAGSLE